MKTIYKREFLSYLRTLPAYFFMASLLLVMGIMFLTYNLVEGYPIFAYSLGTILLIFIFTIPMITMNTFSEERKSKTDQMLLTAPVNVSGIVLGKFFAAWTIFAIPMMISCIFPLFLLRTGNAYPATDYSTILAMLLMGGLYISIGCYISSLTENQMVAAIITALILLMLQLWPTWITYLPMSGRGSFLCFAILLIAATIMIWNSTRNMTVGIVVLAVGAAVLCIIAAGDITLLAGVFPRILEKIDMTTIFHNFAYNNVFDVEGIIRYLSVTGLFLFLTVQSVEKRRWV